MYAAVMDTWFYLLLYTAVMETLFYLVLVYHYARLEVIHQWGCTGEALYGAIGSGQLFGTSD